MGEITVNPSSADAPEPSDPRAERRAHKLAKQISAFARSHGGSSEGQIAYLGEIGTRIVLVGRNGEWGDLVAPSYEIARRAVELAGITAYEEFSGEIAAKLRTGRYEWTRMAGIQLGGPANT